MNKTERKVRENLKNSYDYVLKVAKGGIKECSVQSIYFEAIIKAKLSSKSDYDELKSLNHFLRSGVPDFLVFDSNYDELEMPGGMDDIEINNVKFIEVKKYEDSLRMSQLDWFKDFRSLPSEIWIVTEKEGHRLSKYRPKDFTASFIPSEFINLMSWQEGDNLEFSIKSSETIEITRGRKEDDET